MQIDRAPLTFLGQLPDGPDGTRDTLKLMVSLVRKFKKHPRVVQVALDLVRPLRPKDWMGEARVLHEYVRDSIRYVRDTRGVETLRTPLVTLDVEQGDCDDKATLLASLLEAIGHPSRFVAIGRQPATYSHVYVQTPVSGTWISLDPTEPVPAGWAPKNPMTVMIANN
jgi:transglutaminase-like putative cysteine protease